MKNSVKKLTSLLLAVILIVGVFTAVPISAGAADTAVPEILGDVDGDGEVTILDATMIRRYEVQLGALSDQQQLAADVDGDGEITILDATWLQRYLNNMKAPEGIGKPMAEVYTVKAIPVLRESVDSTERAQVRVYADQPHVPYMNVKDFYDRFYLLGTDLKEGMTMTQSGSEYTLTNIADVSATFDVAKDSIYTSNFESFTQLACSLQIMASGGVDNNYPFAKTTDTNEPVDPNPLTLDVSEYGIDLRGDDTGVYAPVATLSDMFATAESFYVMYVGDKFYTKEFTRAHQTTAASDSDPEFAAAIKEDHPADLADFTYRELCFNLDLWYGQPGQEYAHDDLETMKLDEMLTTKYPEIKANLQSTDFKAFFAGLYHLINGLLFDGGHTTIASASLNADVPLLLETIQPFVQQEYSQKYRYANKDKARIAAERTKARNAVYQGDYYIEQGDTAMIHFDAFAVDYEGWKAFYAGQGERPLIFTNAEGPMYDTVGTVLSGLERAKQNPEIKNIVIDMTCNGGGDSTAMMAIEWLINGKGYMLFSNQHTGRVKTSSVDFDMNFDGVFDENDVSPYTDYHFGVLTSSYAFSCGNAFPWFMHERGAIILGERSSGGVCAIRFNSVAGVEFANSSAAQKIVSDSGENVDFGCPIDVDLMTDGETNFDKLYDLSLISEKMNEYYNK